MDPMSYCSLFSCELDEVDELCTDVSMEHSSLATSAGVSQRESVENLRRKEMSSGNYSSVLKLSEVASALQGFSKTSPMLSLALQQPISYSPGESLPSFMPSHGRPPITTSPNESVYQKEVGDWKPTSQDGSSPPPTPCTTTTGRAIRDVKTAALHELNQEPISKDGATQREMRVYSERQRRRNMTDHFATLQSLIPRRKLKRTDRITVLTEVTTYIQSLRRRVEELDCKKGDIMALLGIRKDYAKNDGLDERIVDAVQVDDDGSTVEVNARLSGRDVFVMLNTPKRRGLWSAVLMFLQRYKVEVVNASLATSEGNNVHHIHGKVGDTVRMDSVDLENELRGVIVKELRRRSRFC